MQDLTLIGVHEDGLHLLLADAEGNRYTVPLDDSLRAAARRDRPRLGQLQNELSGGLRPAAVQSMIRAGLTAEEAAERAGWTVEKVHKYEGPILAEREHVAGLARQVRLRSRGASHGASTTLEARVTERLVSREIDPAAVAWDSRRADKGEWIVSLAFAAGGREREAAWRFDPLARIVSALDDESRWLSEDDDTPAPGPLPAPHLATPARPAKVYDVEAEGGVGAPTARGRSTRSSASSRAAGTRPAPTPDSAASGTSSPVGESPEGGEPLDLVAAMRQRNAQRGRRRRPRGADVPGLDEAPEEALPLEELALDPRDHVPPPAQHPHPEDEAEQTAGVAEVADTVDVDDEVEEGGAHLQAGHTADAEHAEHAADDDNADELDELDDTGGATPEPEPEPQPTPVSPPKPGPRPRQAERTQPVRQGAPGAGSSSASRADNGQDDGDELIEEQVAPSAASPKRPAPARPAARKGGRPSVPSWDDIMFGRKGD
ncbi:MAG TPA: septation protein SepH [Humibacillus xanthopallidus]|nr:septation protein SepH [Humibacillus xanthopallidus]